jgi:hypothetical protein
MSNKRGFVVRRRIAGLSMAIIGAAAATEAANRNADRRTPGKRMMPPIRGPREAAVKRRSLFSHIRYAVTREPMAGIRMDRAHQLPNVMPVTLRKREMIPTTLSTPPIAQEGAPLPRPARRSSRSVVSGIC